MENDLTQQTFAALQDVLKTFSRHLLKTSSTCLQHNNFTSCKTKNYYVDDVFKTSSRHVLNTSWRHILKTSSRRLGGKHVYWWYLYLKNLNVYLTNLCFTNLYLTNLGRMRHLEPNNFDIRLILKHTSISILRIKISEIGEWASEAIKTKF